MIDCYSQFEGLSSYRNMLPRIFMFFILLTELWLQIEVQYNLSLDLDCYLLPMCVVFFSVRIIYFRYLFW